MIRISNIKISADIKPDINMLKAKAEKILKTKINDIKIAKKSIDARKKDNVFYLYSVDVSVNNEKKYLKYKNVSKTPIFNYKIKKCNPKKSPVIVGFGPGGMFAGLLLAYSGAKPVILERGYSVEKRQEAINNFQTKGILDTKSNVQFGEGGAGTFSDGKLTTGISDERCMYVLKKLADFGAPKEILYLSKPHIGTDILIDIVRNIRKEIIKYGGKVLFEHKMCEIKTENNKLKSVIADHNGQKIEFETDNCILAIGHSSRDTFEYLKKINISMVQKAFAMGVRIEHKQDMINKAQYGKFAEFLPPADYKLFTHLDNGRGAYTFCMCPGGVVMAAASEENTVVTNGMSYYKRDKENANSALLIGIDPKDFGSDDVLAGMYMQRDLEKKAFIEGGSNYNAPIQKVGDILKGVKTTSIGNITPSYKPDTTPSDFKNIFPDFIYESIKLAIKEFDKKIEGFASDDAILTAVESRSSSPVRILRDKDSLVSVTIDGLYPCGEGCGYAGGIMSAAVDGLKCGEKVIDRTMV
ncbi:MAG: NAD(P)/FAD-dependent oxidoreductase [Lachnospirales bacterium]